MNKKNVFKKRILIWDLICLILLIVIDRITKYLALAHCKKENYMLIQDTLEITYLENYGGILGTLNNQRFFFIFISAIFICLILFFLFALPNQKKFTFLNIWLIFIMSGSIGNLLDRIIYGFVVDFIYFSSLNFPVFNLSDIWVSFGMIGTLIVLVFQLKEKDLEFLNFKQNKYREIK